mmetsp:Transcript_3052/g.4352  ORF Transcript_3052/g.4352 Transcript_3052/m.4352 type:complete len:91 (-) Transcript_3052:1124-1396(-)
MPVLGLLTDPLLRSSKGSRSCINEDFAMEVWVGAMKLCEFRRGRDVDPESEYMELEDLSRLSSPVEVLGSGREGANVHASSSALILASSR